MKKLTLKNPARSGAALVIALALLVLLTTLVISFLSSMRLDRLSTQNYSHSVKAQELALGAMQEIVADLKQEINAGSRQEAEFTVNGKRVFMPVNSATSVPARIGFAPADYGTDPVSGKLPPSLLRVSRGSDPFFDGPPSDYDADLLATNRASSFSTSTASSNGRKITKERWNKPKLLGDTAPSAFGNRPPDWVFVTRDGSKVCTDAEIESLKSSRDLSNKSQVLGRYAFVIYEQGGLLDVNTAGFPSTLGVPSNGPGAQAIRSKTALAYADLTQLPGLSGRSTELTSLVNWRNKGGINLYGGFVEMQKKLQLGGFLRFEDKDSPFLSRQDLIDYFQKKIGSTAALPYLGTFSRSVNAPSWSPKTPSDAMMGKTSSINYAAEAENDGAINRDLPNVRFTRAGTITHYLDDATAKTYEVEAGDALLQSRFSLARLDWLKDGDPNTGNGPSSSSPRGEAIQAAFGLVWDFPGGSVGAGRTANGGNKCWNYVGVNGSPGSPASTILTLDQVAKQNREPDFFELLKATILSGSVGKDPGPACSDNGNYKAGNYSYRAGTADKKMGPVGLYAYTFGPGSNVPAPARKPDMQIIRIGANIIDQYDKDSYPTAIYFKYDEVANLDPATGSKGNPIFGSVTMAFGTENLPYMTKMQQLTTSPVRSSSGPAGPSTDSDTHTFGGWRQPELWNPHQQPSDALTSHPTRFQIRAYGSSVSFWGWHNGAGSGTTHVVDYFLTNDNSEICDVGTINFTDTSSTSAFYDKPYPLLYEGIPGVTASSPYKDGYKENRGNPGMADFDTDMLLTKLPNHFVGFSTGFTPDTNEGAPYMRFVTSYSTGSGRGCGMPVNTYTLGWIDDSDRYHPYSYLTGVFPYTYNEMQNTMVGSANGDRLTADTWILPDPRTDRFSLSIGSHVGGGTLRPSSTVYRDKTSSSRSSKGGTPTAPGFYAASGSYTFFSGDWMINHVPDGNNASTHTDYYADPDGIVRPGDGYYATTSTGDGMMLFTSKGAPTPATSPLISAGDKTVNLHGRRPIVLNRAFNSVGELGYVFRDQPFKTLDFFTSLSADTGLIDVFALTDTFRTDESRLQSLDAGKVNPNSASNSVLLAILNGAGKKEIDTGYNLANEAKDIAKKVVEQINTTTGRSPVTGLGELIPSLVGGMRASVTITSDKGNKAYLEAPLRALSGVTNFRTWNLLIDVIAQSGKFNPGATSVSQFSVEGERRYWLHVAIDRYTGEIVDQQLEPVYE